MSFSIKVNDLAKLYHIGQQGDSKLSLVGTLANAIRHPSTIFQGHGPKPSGTNDLWALDGVSFEVKPGEIVGIIGRNGAGKSTLLKILSRITRPTRGQVEFRGRLASLLEVGTGFHPDLTGRENVFMNGSILGLTKSEIIKKFDEIVEFAEVSRFIDTRVKYYSSGMYVRLAFSVAAHLDPDILLLDEVLGVGDTAFQKKCFRRLQSIASGRYSVLIVSHNLSTIRMFCKRVILIHNGKVLSDASPDVSVGAYFRLLEKPRNLVDEGMKDRLARSTGAVRISDLVGFDSGGKETWTFKKWDTARIRVHYEVLQDIPNLRVIFCLRGALSGDPITSIKHTISSDKICKGRKGSFELEFAGLPLCPGQYYPTFYLTDVGAEKIFDVVDDNIGCPFLTVSSSEEFISEELGYFSIPYHIRNLRA